MMAFSNESHKTNEYPGRAIKDGRKYTQIRSPKFVTFFYF